jgi:hypothetical protein
MEMSQGNSLCSYIKQTKKSLFFFYKFGEQEGGTGSGTGLVPVGGGRRWGKDEGRCKYCVCMYINGKIGPVETIPGMGEGRIKE